MRTHDDLLCAREGYVDFSEIPERHRDIDARLVNWARWSLSRGGGPACSPMFRLYRPTEAAQVFGEPTASKIDALDAMAMQTAVAMLGTRYRLALSWCYIKRSNPRRAAADLGETVEGLRALVDAARDRLIGY